MLMIHTFSYARNSNSSLSYYEDWDNVSFDDAFFCNKISSSIVFLMLGLVVNCGANIMALVMVGNAGCERICGSFLANLILLLSHRVIVLREYTRAAEFLRLQDVEVGRGG